MQAYRIADEPKPGTLSQFVVSPFWPLFGMMFGGFWLALPWFLFNSFAMGSPTRKKELVIAVLGLIGSAVLVFGFIALTDQGIFSEGSVQYGMLAILVWKLGISYWLYMTQAATFDIYTYFGGIARNGIIVVFLSMFLRGGVLKTVHDNFGAIAMLVLR